MNALKISSAALAVVLVTLLLAPRANAADLVRVATGPTDSGAAVYYAQELGLFDKAGLDVKIDSLASGAAVAAGVASGTIDIAQGSLPSLFSAHERGIPFVLIAPGGLYSSRAPTSALVVSKSSALKTAKDLNGKIIANNALKNIGEIAADAWLDAGGADIASVKILEMPLGEMESALGQGRIDAAILVEPSLGLALSRNIKILAPAYTSIAPSFMINAYFANADWVKAHADVVKRFDTVVRAAGKWANAPANRARSAAILEKYTKVSMSPQNTRIVYADTLDPALIQPVIDATAKYKVIKTTFPAKDIIMIGAQ